MNPAEKLTDQERVAILWQVRDLILQLSHLLGLLLPPERLAEEPAEKKPEPRRKR